jgi:hypothetical protein
VSGPLLDHDRIGGVHAVHHSAQVDVYCRLPVVEGQVLSLTRDRNPRIVEDQIEPTVYVADLTEQGFNRRIVSDVQSGGARNARSAGGERCRHPFGAGGVKIGDDHRVASPD